MEKTMEERMDAIEQKLAIHIAIEEERQAKMQEDLAEIKTSIQGLLSAWNAAGAAGHFLKWVSMVVAGYFAIIEFLRYIK